MNRKNLVAAAVLVSVLVVAVAFGAGMVMAASNAKPRKSIVERLSERFNLKEDDVKKVFTEAQEERFQAMRDAFEERLNEAVKNGKITEAQKATILEKQDQILAKQKELIELQQELREWADDNNIDLSILGLGFKYRMGRPRGGFGPGPCW